MKKKLLLLSLVMLFAAPSMMAQLTKGTPGADIVRTGNRAKAGDFGFYFSFYNMGAEYMFGAFDRQFSGYESSRSPIPLVNVKYMVSNELEFRMGIEIKKQTLRANTGELSIPGDTDSFMNQTQNLLTMVDNIITPGIAYHFSKSNILDVYIGAELPLGYTRDRMRSRTDIEDNFYFQRYTSNTWNVGLAGFLGLQAYIGNLPLAIGMEWGIFGRFNLNNKGTFEVQMDKDSDPIKQYMITHDEIANEFGFGPFDEITTARKFFAGNQLRFTITYFFNK